MSWNYRMIVKKDPSGNVYWGIHEVYYDPGFRPKSMTEKSVTFFSETETGLKEVLKMVLEAFDKAALIGWAGPDFLTEYDEYATNG